jgi:hypothetical protein
MHPLLAPFLSPFCPHSTIWGSWDHP